MLTFSKCGNWTVGLICDEVVHDKKVSLSARLEIKLLCRIWRLQCNHRRKCTLNIKKHKKTWILKKNHWDKRGETESLHWLQLGKYSLYRGQFIQTMWWRGGGGSQMELGSVFCFYSHVIVWIKTTPKRKYPFKMFVVPGKGKRRVVITGWPWTFSSV